MAVPSASGLNSLSGRKFFSLLVAKGTLSLHSSVWCVSDYLLHAELARRAAPLKHCGLLVLLSLTALNVDHL
jgi:hypothetical protein